MMEYRVPSLLEFKEFFQAARSLMPTSVFAPKTSETCPSLSEYKKSTDHLSPFDMTPNLKLGAKISKMIVSDLQSHVVFQYLFKNVYFQKALIKFTSHRYYINKPQSGIDEKTFQDCVILFLMCHVAATFIAYLEYQEPVFEGITKTEKKRWSKQIEDFEKLAEEKRLNLNERWKNSFEMLISTMKSRISPEKEGLLLPQLNKRTVMPKQKSALRLLLNAYLVEYGGFCKIVLKNIAKTVLTEDSEISIERWVDEIQKEIEHGFSWPR